MSLSPTPRSLRNAAALVLLAGGLFLATALPATAQGYEGSDTEDGVFSVPNGEVAPGDVIEFTVTGLAPNAVVNIVLVDADGNPVADTSSDLSVTVTAGPGGTATATVPVPSYLDEGSFSVVATSVKADGSDFYTDFSFDMSPTSAQPTPDPAEDPPGLAITGASSTALALGASMLILLGAGLVLSTKPSKVEEL